MLVPLGREHIVLSSEIVGAITDLILNGILIPLYGASGAAVGTLVAELVVFVVQYFYLRNEVSHSFGSIHYVRIIIATGLGDMGSFWVKNLNVTYFMIMILSALLFFGIYFIFMLLMKEELVCELISRLMHHRLSS